MKTLTLDVSYKTDLIVKKEESLKWKIVLCDIIFIFLIFLEIKFIHILMFLLSLSSGCDKHKRRSDRCLWSTYHIVQRLHEEINLAESKSSSL